ncbi:MAG: hypothetical protein GXP62_01195 [Oligoflexia bacterium]|nr:hypothetical protein [Oligoflexia bacterium]
MRHRSIIVGAVLLSLGSAAALLPSCAGFGSVDRDSFYGQYAELSCKVNKDCFKGFFESQWTNQSDCVDELTAGFQDYVDYYADCSFDEDAAKACLKSINTAQCAAFYDEDDTIYADCLSVWSCDQESSGKP